MSRRVSEREMDSAIALSPDRRNCLPMSRYVRLVTKTCKGKTASSLFRHGNKGPESGHSSEASTIQCWSLPSSALKRLPTKTLR